MSPRLVPAAALALALAAPALPAQDTLRLGPLQRAAVAADPRLAQRELQRHRTALRLRDIDAERLPSLAVEGVAQLQSDVTAVPVAIPGVSIQGPARDTYDARVAAQQRLLDFTMTPRRAVERAQLAQAEAQLAAALFPLRQQVGDAFFQALLLQEREAELGSVITDLDASLAQARARVAAGTALPGEAATLEAELLRRQEDRAAVRADRAAALELLAELTGTRASDAPLGVPELADAVARARAASGTAAARPEYAGFERARETLVAQEHAVGAQRLPRLLAFGRAGYGRPGLDMLSREWDTYWLAGVQLQWAPWTWGTNRRTRETLRLQQDVVRTEEAAFTAAVRRATVRDLATMDRLAATLAADDRIIALRERVERETRTRLGEGVVTAAEYVNRRTDVLDARIARAQHRVELAQARARYLTTLGIDLP